MLAFLPALCFAQTFEGEAVYQNRFLFSGQATKMGLDSATLVSKMIADGDISEVVRLQVKGGSFAWSQVGHEANRQVYRAGGNKLYSFFEGADVCKVYDVTVDAETVLLKTAPSATLLDTQVLVAGQACKVVRVRWKSGHYDYYFSPGFLPVDGSLFANYKYDGWGAYLAIANALPLRIDKVSSLMTISTTLQRAEGRAVDAGTFALPQLAPANDLKSFVPGQTFLRVAQTSGSQKPAVGLGASAPARPALKAHVVESYSDGMRGEIDTVTGYQKYYYPNGGLKMEGKVSGAGARAYRDSLWKYYNEAGQLMKQEISNGEGKLSQTDFLYFSNGKLMSKTHQYFEGDYKNKATFRFHKVETLYYTNGQPMALRHWVNKELLEEKCWDPKGGEQPIEYLKTARAAQGGE
ncbi:MAG: hypothetical protein EOO12_03410 [Chitinophagaceae bacterium]|nr:MAG: hypothetical protein EOO12_03410 [Chitinophagaceae bacterium]